VNKAAVHFFEIEHSTVVKGLPHSKQLAFNRDVISPQFGHILCDPDPATCAFTLRIPWSSRIVNSTISRPKKMLVAFISDPSCRVLHRPSQSLKPRADIAELTDFAQVAADGIGRPLTR
jgi:hypothetical protein